jgi:Na+/melibiose symporter-like transporter
MAQICIMGAGGLVGTVNTTIVGSRTERGLVLSLAGALTLSCALVALFLLRPLVKMFGRRKLCILVAGAGALVSLAFALLLTFGQQVGLGPVFVYLALIGVISQMNVDKGRIAEFVDGEKGRKQAARLLNSLYTGINRCVAPVLGTGMVIVLGNEAWVYYTVSVMWAVTAVLFASRHLPEPVETKTMTGVKGVVVWLWQDHEVRLTLLSNCISNLAHAIAFSTFLLYVQDRLHGGDLMYTNLVLVSQVGLFLGAVTAEKFESLVGRFTSETALLSSVLSLAATAVGLAAMAWVPSVLTVIAAQLLWGVTASSRSGLMQQIVLTRQPDRTDQVSAAIVAGALSFSAVGNLIGGVLFDTVGGIATILCGAGVSVAGILVVLWARSRGGQAPAAG